MTSRRSDAAAPAPVPPGGKGRPTPKRRDREKRRTGPVAPPPTTRKEAAKRQKEAAREARRQLRQGTLAGDERYLTKRDAGPVRKLVRDVVDSRRNVAVLLLPVALLLVVAQVSGVELLQRIAFTAWTAALLAAFLDTLLLVVTVVRRVRRDFPDERRAGAHAGYAFLRSTVFRRWRMPAAAVRPGDPV